MAEDFKILCVRRMRKACEHLCFSGAAVDLIFFTFGFHVFWVDWLGKFAFAAGALGVYLLHAEEARHRREQQGA